MNNAGRGQARTDGAFFVDIRVYYEDTDAAGVVYYANYLRFMERARTEWLRELGIPMDVQARTERTAAPTQAPAAQWEKTQARTDQSDHDRNHGDSPQTDLPIFVVRHAQVDYAIPARLNDLLRVTVRLGEDSVRRRLRGAAFWLDQEVRLNNATDDHAAGTLLVSGRIQVASIDPATFRPRRLPKWAAARMLEAAVGEIG